METAIGSIVTKIDAVLIKLEKMENHKNKRKAAMSNIMTTINEKEGGKWLYYNIDEWVIKMVKIKIYTIVVIVTKYCNMFHIFFSRRC